MSNQVSDLTVRVNNLQHAKDSLENKVNSLEAEMDCIMGRSGGCNPSKCLNGGSLISVCYVADVFNLMLVISHHVIGILLALNAIKFFASP